MKIIRFLLAIILSGGLFSCSNLNKSAEDNELETTSEKDSLQVSLSSEQAENADLQLGNFVQIELSELVEANGYLELPPNDMASVNPPVEGFIESIPLQAGNEVRKGQIVALISHPGIIEVQQDYLEAAGKFEYFERELERQQILSDANVTAKKKLQETRADYKAAKARYNSLKEKLKLMGISPSVVENGNISSTLALRAPIDGVITSVAFHKGQQVSPNEPVVEITNNENLQISLKVFEKDIRKVKEGQKFTFNIPSYENSREHEGTIKLVGKDLKGGSNSITVYGELEKTDDLIPGLYVEAEIRTGSKEVRALPDEAIILNNSRWYFFDLVKEDESRNVFKAIRFKPGIKSNGFTEIKESEGIIDSSRLVLKGAFYLKSEMNKTEEIDD